MRMHNYFKLVVAIGVSELAGVIGSVVTVPAIQSGWYAGLVKPALNPPSWVFGPVWTALFALMGIALFFVLKKHPYKLEFVRMLCLWRWAIGLFGLQLVLNALWSMIFFGLHSPGGALVEIVVLWLAILATMIAFAKISRLAAWLLAPYLLWVTFASYLTYTIWILN